ncbi:hypothetical protein ABE10_02650, partial [Bacillus toyonensis]|nr:hypothetical protein [Bacillus toyonensis]
MDLRDYLRVFRAHWLGMLLIIVAGVAAAFGWTLLQPKVYTADTSAIVQTRSANGSDSNVGEATLGNTLAISRVKTYVELGTSRAVAERVIKDLGLKTSPDAISSRISVSNAQDTPSLKISASAGDPQGAKDLAESWARAMVSEVNKLESGDAARQGSMYLQPIDSARLPSSPSSPNVRLALLIGGLAGLALAIAYGLLRYTLDRRIRSVESVERETGVAVVGTIPEEKSFTSDDRLIPFDGGNTLGSANAHLFPIAEAMRELRTNIQFM